MNQLIYQDRNNICVTVSVEGYRCLWCNKILADKKTFEKHTLEHLEQLERTQEKVKDE